MNLIHLESVDSTNQYIKENYHTLNHLDVVTTKNQTKGKGRHINQWFSSQDSLTFSLLLKEHLEQRNLTLLPLLMAKVLHQVISQHTKNVTIKWPNDIYIQDKKIAGILIESIYQNKLDAMIIGVGINLNNMEYPDDIDSQVISLKQVTHQTFSHESLLREIVETFKSSLHQLNNDSQSIINYCNQYHTLNNQDITYEDKKTIKSGKCIKINEDGHLLIQTDKQTKTLISGTVHKIRNQ